jgi:hypothetical protein
MLKRILASFGAVVGATAIAVAANISLLSGPQDPSQLLATVNGLIQSINSQITPQSMAPFSGPRNYLDNGSMQVQQRGTGTVTCAANAAITSAAYGADRWGCQANVGSAQGRMQVITASPAPPTDFTASMKLWRNSAALTQPVCAWQEVPTTQATELANQTVTVSAYVQALAGLSADNGNAFNLVIITGTGTDEGFGTPTASPAITPAWTGIATPLNSAQTATTAWVRYQASVTLASTVTEIGVGICFTPTATGAGATDGLAFTGVQLEQGAAASSYEFRPIATETARAQRYFWRINEAAAGVVQVGGGSAQGTTTTCTTYIPFLVQMRAAPTYSNALTASTFKIVSASQAATALSTPFSATLAANTVNGASINFTTTGMTAKDGCFLVGAAGGGVMDFTADF